jgi:imidazolonepropionase-like amidohydrolase
VKVNIALSKIILTICLIISALLVSPILFADTLPSNDSVLFKNVRIFDGKNNKLSDPMNMLITGNKINKISPSPILVSKNTQIIEGNGRTLMPGMIDTHVHITMSGIKFSDFLKSDGEYIGIIASNEARKTLFRGFTTVRDMAGDSFGIKKAIDEGEVIGPRIYPSGAALSQTGGHMDLNGPTDPPRHLGGSANPSEKIRAGIIADGIPDVLTAAREQLRRGASQIKVMAGGGIATKYDPIDVVEYSEDEIHAAVIAASNWGTYVAVHVYNPTGIKRALHAGVKSIEHGNLIDEPTMKLLAKKDAFLSPQVVVWTNVPAILGESSLAQAKQLATGLDQMFSLAKKYHPKITFGTDILFNPGSNLESKEITARLKWFTPFEILKQATLNGANLLALSGPRNPYPGKLGVIEEGALADLLLVDGNPLANLSLLEDPDKNLKMIMKDGKIYKNTL